MNSRPDDHTTQDGAPNTSECAFVMENLEAFALDALDRFERGVVEHHVRWCERCQQEAVRYERVAEHLAFAVPAGPDPRPEIKSKLFERIEAHRSGLDQAPVSRTPDTERDLPAEPKAAGRWWHPASAALIAPLVLALVVMGVWANSMRTDLDEQATDLESHTILNQALANGGQVALYSVEKEKSCPTCHGSGQLGMSSSNDMGMVLGWNFDPDKRHDVWGVSGDGNTMKMCELEVDPTGAVMQMFTFPDAPSAFTEVYITDENGSMTYVSHLAQSNDATPEEDPGPGSPTT